MGKRQTKITDFEYETVVQAIVNTVFGDASFEMVVDMPATMDEYMDRIIVNNKDPFDDNYKTFIIRTWNLGGIAISGEKYLNYSLYVEDNKEMCGISLWETVVPVSKIIKEARALEKSNNLLF